jgi:hypothetical protein
MADVFISWSSPDRHIVLPFKNRLMAEGWTVHEYSDDQVAGSIDDMVAGYVNDCEIALIFVSPRSVKKDWLIKEANWCSLRRTNCRAAGQKERPVILPVILGNVAENELTPDLKHPDLRRFPLPDNPPDEVALRVVLDSVARTLGETPYVVPVAMLAMDHKQAAALFDPTKNPKWPDTISNLCKNAGLLPPMEAMLLDRYPGERDDFAPFSNGSLKKTLELTLKLANEARRERGAKRLSLWWCTDALFSTADMELKKRARSLWQSRESILMVDSLSILHPDIQRDFNNLPSPRNAADGAVLWLPPYTRHTAQLATLIEATLSEIAGQVQRLYDKYQAWGVENQEPYIAFDIGTDPTLRRWFFRAFGDMGSAARPIATNIMAVTAQYAATIPNLYKKP